MSHKLLKQHEIRWFGSIVDSILSTLPFISIYSGISITIILYAQVKDYLLNIFPWMTLGVFFVLILVVFTIVALLVYKYVIPSIWGFRSRQMSHLEKKIDEIAKKLNINEKKDDNTG